MLDVVAVEVVTNPLTMKRTHLPEIMLSVAAILVVNGFSVGVYPCSANLPRSRFLLLQCDIQHYPTSLSIAQKANGATVILCGNFVTAEPGLALRSSLINYGIVGDPEYAMLDLVREVNPASIQGLASPYFVNPNTDLKASELPVPDYRAWRGKWMSEATMYSARERTFSNGSWMYRGVSGRRRWYQFKRQVSALRYYGVRRVIVLDEDFAAGTAQVTSMVNALNASMESWQCSIMSESVVTNNLATRLGSKCDVILDIGAADDRMLSMIGRADLSTHWLAIERLRSAGVPFRLRVTVGWPGESRHSLENSARWLNSTGCRVEVRTFVPTPGSFEGLPDTFEVTATDFRDFMVDDQKDIFSVPWRSGSIESKDFVQLRNEMVRTYNRNGAQLCPKS